MDGAFSIRPELLDRDTRRAYIQEETSKYQRLAEELDVLQAEHRRRVDERADREAWRDRAEASIAAKESVIADAPSFFEVDPETEASLLADDPLDEVERELVQGYAPRVYRSEPPSYVRHWERHPFDTNFGAFRPRTLQERRWQDEAVDRHGEAYGDALPYPEQQALKARPRIEAQERSRGKRPAHTPRQKTAVREPADVVEQRIDREMVSPDLDEAFFQEIREADRQVLRHRLEAEEKEREAQKERELGRRTRPMSDGYWRRPSVAYPELRVPGTKWDAKVERLRRKTW